MLCEQYNSITWVQVLRFCQRGRQGWPLGEAAGAGPCWTWPVAAGSKMDPLLAEAEAVSQAGGASGKAYLRAKCSTAVRGAGESVWETALETLRSERQEVLQILEQRFLPCSSWRRPQWSRYPPCGLWRTHGGAGLSWRTAARAGEKCVEEEAAKGNHYGLTPVPTAAQGGVSGAWEGERGRWFNFCLFCYPYQFELAIN